ncbi:META domain-containing protein [Kribbella sp. NPDC055071]
MSNTDLEDDLRGTFDRAAASVPQANGLTERATTGARRAQRRTWIVSGTAAVAVAAIAVAGFGLAGSNNKPVQPPVAGPETPAATTAAPEPPTSNTVAGTWRMVSIAGAKFVKGNQPDDPVLVLRPDGTWGGSDGCNPLQGTFTIGQRGEFAATAGPQRLVGCDNVAHTGVLVAAKRVAVDGDTLQFFAADGHELAKYAR